MVGITITEDGQRIVSDLSIILTPADFTALLDHLLYEQAAWRRAWGDTQWELAGALAEFERQYPARVARRRKAMEQRNA